MYLKFLGFGQTTISVIPLNFKKSTLSVVIHAGINHQALWQERFFIFKARHHILYTIPFLKN
ncbi:hypothetical protein ACFL0M_07130 [Thermodesulfobacteriota bacterium]